MGPWAWAREAFAGRVRFQITATGLLFLAAILMVGMAAFVSANNLLFLVLAAMLSTLMVSGFISRLSLAGLEVDLILPEHVTARQNVAARMRVANAKRWTPSFSIYLAGAEGSAVTTELYFPVIPGGQELEELVEMYFARRGQHAESSFQFSTRFPFGFTERRVRVKLARDVLVYPSIEPRPGFEEMYTALSGEIEAHYRGRGNDFYRIRPYEAFESARHVDWRATAHTGALQVREFARDQEQTVEVLLDCLVEPAGEEWFERAVDCCAYLCWKVAGRGARLRFRTGAVDLRLPEETDIYGILRVLALVAPTRDRQPLAAPDDGTSFQIVFTLEPERAARAGWHNARMLGLEDVPAAPPSR